jgi:hypothetical protein
MTSTFLTKEEVRVLTGRAYRTKQVAALARRGIPFTLDDFDRPIVPRSAIEGKGEPPTPTWEPRCGG